MGEPHERGLVPWERFLFSFGTLDLGLKDKALEVDNQSKDGHTGAGMVCVVISILTYPIHHGEVGQRVRILIYTRLLLYS
jgi:hypothetical protein